MKFNATTRSVQGTSASRRLRRAGRVPGIVYGGSSAPANVELDHNEIYHALRKEAFHSSILSMQLDKKNEQVLVRSVQWHPYKQQVLHVDFQRVTATEELTTRVPLHFLNGEESPAVKLASAVITHVLTELEITCLPADLPVSIEVDLGQLESGATVHLSDITLPKGVVAVQAEVNPALATALAKGGGAGDDDGDAEADEEGAVDEGETPADEE